MVHCMFVKIFNFNRHKSTQPNIQSNISNMNAFLFDFWLTLVKSVGLFFFLREFDNLSFFSVNELNNSVTSFKVVNGELRMVVNLQEE